MDQRANDARARILARQQRTSIGLDPMVLADVVIIGAAKLTRGAVNFAKWSDAMIKDLGPEIKDYLKDAWKQSTKDPDVQLTKLEDTIAKPVVT
jgi:hypothetical protein